MGPMPVLQFVVRSTNKLCRSVQKLCIAVGVRGCVWVSKASTSMMLSLKGGEIGRGLDEEIWRTSEEGWN
jgi:hypothetical protein